MSNPFERMENCTEEAKSVYYGFEIYAEDRIKKCMGTFSNDAINNMLIEVTIHCKNDDEIVIYCKQKVEYYKKILCVNKMAMNANMIAGRTEDITLEELDWLDDQFAGLMHIESEAATRAAQWLTYLEAKTGSAFIDRV